MDTVTRLRNQYTAHLPPVVNTQEIKLINLRESVFNVQVYKAEKVHIERCVVQNFKSIVFNKELKELFFVDNRIGFVQRERTSSYRNCIQDFLQLVPAVNQIEKLEMGFRDNHVESIIETMQLNGFKKLQSLRIIKVRLLKDDFITLKQLLTLGKALSKFIPKVSIKCNKIQVTTVYHCDRDFSSSKTSLDCNNMIKQEVRKQGLEVIEYAK